MAEDERGRGADALNDVNTPLLEREEERNRTSPLTAILTYFVFVTGQTFILAANIDILLELICYDEYSREISTDMPLLKDPRCRQSNIAARVANFSSYEPVITGILGVLVVPKLAAWSDKVGRKPILMVGAFACAINDLIRILCVTFPDKLSYRWLLVAYIARGAGGTWPAMQMLNATYVADCSTSKTRSQYLSLLEAFFYGAIALGPFLGSIFHSLVGDYTAQFAVTLATDLVYIGLVAFVVKESRSKEAQLEAQLSHENNNHSAWNIFKPLGKLTFDHLDNAQGRRNARILVLLMALVADIGVAVAPLFMIYGEFKFDWSSVETGFMMTFFGISRTAILGIVYPATVKLLGRWWHFSPHTIDRIDLLLLRIGFFVSACTFLAVAAAPNGTFFMIAVIVDSVAGVLMPTLKSSVLKYTEPANIGKVMGAISFLTSVTMIFSTQLFARIYSFTVAVHPQFVFEVAALGFYSLVGLTFTLKPTLSQYEQEFTV